MANVDAKPDPEIGQPGPAALAGAGGEPSLADAARWVYRLFYSKTLGLGAILALAALTLLGTLVGQAAPGVLDEPAAKAEFMEAARQKYGGWAWVLDGIGGFRVFSSWTFIGVVVVLGLSITACTAHRLPQLWRAWRHPQAHAPSGLFETAPTRQTIATAASPGQARQRVAALLKASRFRVIEPADDAVPQLYADRWAWGGVGTVLAHLSFIGILAAFALSGAGGIDQALNLAVGAGPVKVPGTPWEVAAEEFDATFSEAGMPLDYVSHLVLYQAGEVVASQDVRVNEPLRRDGVKFHQSSYGMAALIEVADASGQVVYQGALPLDYRSEDGSRVIGLAEMPGTGSEIQVSVAASGQEAAALSGLEPGQARVTTYLVGSTSPTGQAVANQGEPAAVGDLSVTFERETQYTGILVRSDPGAWLMWAASALLIIGMTITFAARHRRLYVLVEPAGDGSLVRLASGDRPGVGLEAPFKSLAGKIRRELDT
ncbi:MAG: cytochrome c biogenesis protein ResB [Bifidobacteriaceae bacterium]|nr:cytochrome c biogenesis protein ResB [Bifidobacteriaceae bacterium]